MNVDWRAVQWWDMPGPSRFVERVAERAGGHPSGVTGLLLPDPRPSGIMEAILARLERRFAVTVSTLDAGHGLRGKSPTTLLSAAIGVVARVRTVEDFLSAPEMAKRVFVLDGVSAEEWEEWAFFLRLLRTERERLGNPMAPALLVLPPAGISPDDFRSATGPEIRYLGVVSRLDTELYAERACVWPDDSLFSRTRVSVIVELSGWDPSMVTALAALDPEHQIDPRARLAQLRHLALTGVPAWSNGRVDRWDGAPFIHTSCLLASERDLAARLWRAHVRTVFPFLNHVRRAFAARYERVLWSRLPITKTMHARTLVYSEPHQLELHDVTEILKDVVGSREMHFLEMCKSLRRQMAHAEPGNALRIARASEFWEEVGDDYQFDCAAWDWPRCGQRLTLVVGPSGAGKSRWAERNRDPSEVFSSDRIRERLYGRLDMVGDQAPVFAELRRQVIARVASGNSAVIDATNIRREDRLANVSLMPVDMSIEYVVIDRPMPEKEATAGWRAKKPGLLAEHARLFSLGLAEILAGDGLPNVSVVDLRTTDARRATD